MSGVVKPRKRKQPRPAPIGWIVVRTDLDELGYCARGARRWFARMGLDWADFVVSGIDAAILEATGDAMALRLIEHLRKKHGRQ